MTISDLKTVRKAVWDARAKWFDIGCVLGMSVSNLDEIKVSYRNRADQCFSEMLTLWLQLDPPPTWSALVDALHSVGCAKLTRHLESEVTNSGPATEVQVGEFIGWHTCEYCIIVKVSDKIIQIFKPLWKTD